MPTRPCLLLTLAALSASPSLAASTVKLPDYVQLPAGADVKDTSSWRYDELELGIADGKTEKKAGKRWHAHLFIDAIAAGTDAKGVWQKFKAAFAATGWAPVVDTERKPTLHRSQKGSDAWLSFSFGGTEADLDVIEAGPPPSALTLKEPGATPEPVDATAGDFPYLAPLPQAKLATSTLDAHPIMVQLPGNDTFEAIGSGAIVKVYSPAEHVTNAEFMAVYTDALTRAGWTLVTKVMRGDCNLTAHYDRHGRNLWAYLRSAPFDNFVIEVADLGDLKSQLSKDCHVTLHGVFFDFNKSTLKPESDSTLNKVADLITHNPALKLEVQGHTDAVGDNAYNQTLSEARAKSVLTWLLAHGAKADHLSSAGYGKSRPVADNSTDEGRAKNRRVEIADPACKPK